MNLLVPVANAPDSDRKDLLSELDLMKKLKPHPHVIKLMACVTETGKKSSDTSGYVTYERKVLSFI